MSETCRRCGGSGFEPNDQASGARMQVARQRKGWTQVELARRVGLSQTTIVALELGRMSPRGKGGQRVLGALGLTLEEVTTP